MWKILIFGRDIYNICEKLKENLGKAEARTQHLSGGEFALDTGMFGRERPRKSAGEISPSLSILTNPTYEFCYICYKKIFLLKNFYYLC